MKILIIDHAFHPKNKEGLKLVLKYLNIEFTFSSNLIDLDNYDIIYSPGKNIDTSQYPSKKYIFGPHFGILPHVFPHINAINNTNNNCCYIQPSQWVKDLFQPNVSIPVVVYPFAVNTEKFKNIERVNPINSKTIFIYFKTRDPKELDLIKPFFMLKQYNIKIINYDIGYSEIDYINILKESMFGVWVGRHESQGFALQEALAMNVPLFVWNVTSLAQEYNGNRPDVPGTAISYWDETCGISFTDINMLGTYYNEFIDKLNSGDFQPRKFIENNLGIESCAKKFKDLFT